MKNSKTPGSVALALPINGIFGRFSTLILVGLAFILMIYSQLGTESVERFRTKMLDITSPFISAISQPFMAVSDSVSGITNIHTLKAENIRLTDENARLRQWYDTALRLDAENQSLRNFLNLEKDPELSYVTARIMADPGGSFVKTLLIPIGYKQNIHKNLAVLSSEGLIGRIIEAGQNSARILLITDLNSHIPVIIQGTRHKGILAGNNSDTLTLEKLPLDSNIEIGARILTSGHGGVLPPNLPIGVITSIKNKTATVKPFSDLRRLDFVQIVKNGDLLSHEE